jgi:hypothetical protein
MAEMNNNDMMNPMDDPGVVSGVENVTKKGGKKAAIIGVGAAAVIAGGGIAAYNLSDLVKNQVKLRTMKAENYYAWVNEENAKTVAEKAADSYREMLDKRENGESASMSLKYELSDDVRDLLKKEMDEEDIEVFGDIVDNAKDLEFGFSADSKDSAANAEYFLNYNGEKLAAFEAAMDMDTMDTFFRVPELSEQWIFISLSEAMEGSYTGDEEIIEAYKSVLKDPESFLSPEELQDIVERYTAVWNSCIDDVDMEKSEEVDIADITVKYTAITIELDEEKAEEIAEAIIEEAKDDDVIKGIVCDKLKICDEDEYEEELDSALEEFDHEADYEYSDEVVELTTYIDAKGVIRGYAAEMGDEGSFNFIIGMDGDDVRGTFSAESDGENVFSGEITAEKSGNAYDGSIDLTFTDTTYDWETGESTDEEKTASVEFTGFEIVDEKLGFFNGDITFIIPDVEPFTINFESDGDSQKVGADLVIDGTDYGRISAELSMKDGGEPEIPDKDGAFEISADSEPEFSDYVSEEDFEKFISEICTKIGLKEDYADELAKAATESVYSSSNYITGSTDYDDWDDDSSSAIIDDDDDWDTDIQSVTDPYESDKVQAEDDQAYLHIYDESFYASYSGWSGSLSYKATVPEIKGDGTYTVGVTADTDGYREYSDNKKPTGIDELSVEMYTDKNDMSEAEITIKSVKVDGKEIEIKGEPIVDSYSYYLTADLVTSEYYTDEEDSVDMLGGALKDKEWTSIEVTFELKGVKNS